MIDITDIGQVDSPRQVTMEGRFDQSGEYGHKTCPPTDSVHKAIETLYADRLKKRFAEVMNSDLSQSSRAPRNEALYQRYLELLQTHLPSRSEINILEIGCGSGQFCQSLSEHGYQAFGVDQSYVTLQQARQISPECEFQRASAYMSFQNLFLRQFDAVVYLDPIEKLQSPRLFIQRACESLAAGGLLIVSARFRGCLINLTNVLPEASQTEQDLLQGHISTANAAPTTLGQLLKEFGLEIVEFQKAGRVPQPWRSQLFVARKPQTTGRC